MSVSALLTELRARDIRIWADGNQLRCNAPAGALTPELTGQLQQCKNEILEFLRLADVLAQQQRALVPLQSNGRGMPVFAVGGHNGDVFCYHALAKCLGDEQPFYGLHPPGLDGQSEPLTRVEDLAAYFAAQIVAFHADGPCAVAGYCAGGAIAFELAQQLLRRGTRVRLVALFGSAYPSCYGGLAFFRQHFTHYLQRAVQHARSLRPQSWPGRARYIRQELHRRREESEAARRDPVMIMRAKMQEITLAAVRRYSPVFLKTRVALFIPNRKWLHSGAAPLRWRSLSQEAEEYFGPDACDLGSMLLEPFAAAFAELFRRARLAADPAGAVRMAKTA